MSARQATVEDIDAIMRVEEDWPEDQRASRETMLVRLGKFREGFWVFEQAGAIIGTLTSCPIRYEPSGQKAFKSWDEVTNRGELPDIDLATANALYLVSGTLKREARGGRTYALLIETPVALAERLGLEYVVAGAKIPGYDAYCRRHGEIDARDYAFLKLNGSFVDPFLEMYRGYGFTVPDRDHVVKDFYPDIPSRNYGAIVVRKLDRSGRHDAP
ncbi:hypothetical protein [Sorangium cellulosum]|uniref:hypothetical protein n=1 Tax=Sorangium cellulosum TaxID=56 RepID=UPI0013315D62|nr:hypothetical protein [Sorangium cellulosum]